MNIPLRGVRFFAPEVAFQDAEKYLPSLLEKRGKPASDVLPALEYLSQIIEIADRDLYASFVKTRNRLMALSVCHL